MTDKKTNRETHVSTSLQDGHEWHSYDQNLPDSVVLKWMQQLESEFDLILIMEHYDVSLAVLVLKFCWKIEDVIYMKVNQQTKTGTELSSNAVKGILAKFNLILLRNSSLGGAEPTRLPFLQSLQYDPLEHGF